MNQGPIIHQRKGPLSYENGIVALMALTFGALFFDRLALNYLVPYVAKDLSLNNTQIGLLAAGLSLAWAFSSYYTTAWAESKNKNKATFIFAIIIFSVCSFGSGLALGFATLLIARLVMGLAEGAGHSPSSALCRTRVIAKPPRDQCGNPASGRLGSIWFHFGPCDLDPDSRGDGMAFCLLYSRDSRINSCFDGLLLYKVLYCRNQD